MVWFYCDDCGDALKKPKLVNHFRQCRSQTFTCVDCSRSFDRQTAQGHNTCVTEHEKYALGATKPGGFAAAGFFNDKGQSQAAATAAAADAGAAEIIGEQFLAERPPWKCSVCNITCTSRDTLMGHAAGVKHKRKARAALGLSGQQQQQQQNGGDVEKKQADTTATTAGDDSPSSAKRSAEAASAGGADEAADAAAEQPNTKKSKKEKKEKKKSKDTAAVIEEDEEKQQQPEEQNEKSGKKSKTEKRNSKKQQEQEPSAETAQQGQQQENVTAKGKKGKRAEPQPANGKENTAAAAGKLDELLKVTKKQLKKKGSVKVKKLVKLLQKSADGSFQQATAETIKQQLSTLSEVKVKGNKVVSSENN